MSETEYQSAKRGSDQRSGNVAADDEGGHEALKGNAGRDDRNRQGMEAWTPVAEVRNPDAAMDVRWVRSPTARCGLRRSRSCAGLDW